MYWHSKTIKGCQCLNGEGRDLWDDSEDKWLRQIQGPKFNLGTHMVWEWPQKLSSDFFLNMHAVHEWVHAWASAHTQNKLKIVKTVEDKRQRPKYSMKMKLFSILLMDTHDYTCVKTQRLCNANYGLKLILLGKRRPQNGRAAENVITTSLF